MKRFNYLIYAGIAILMLTNSCENEKERSSAFNCFRKGGESY
jgi:hypothetical protein